MASNDINVFYVPINVGNMKMDLGNVPKNELVLRVVACCNEIERGRGDYNDAVDEINRCKMELKKYKKFVKKLGYFKCEGCSDFKKE